MNQVAPSAVETNAPAVPTRSRQSGRIWLRIFLGGMALWVATVLVTFAT